MATNTNPYSFPLGNYGMPTSTTDWSAWANQNNVPLVYNDSYMQGFQAAQSQMPQYNTGQTYIPSDRLNRTMYTQQPFVSTNYTGFGSDYIGQGKLFANGGDALGAVGNVLSGVGSLAQAWTAYKGLDLARESMENQNAQWDKNYEAQRINTNNAIANQNAWKAASGRTDLGAYVGDWSTAGNLTPTKTA